MSYRLWYCTSLSYFWLSQKRGKGTKKYGAAWQDIRGTILKIFLHSINPQMTLASNIWEFGTGMNTRRGIAASGRQHMAKMVSWTAMVSPIHRRHIVRSIIGLTPRRHIDLERKIFEWLGRCEVIWTSMDISTTLPTFGRENRSFVRQNDTYSILL